jgi:Cu2+-exporting ATPase
VINSLKKYKNIKKTYIVSGDREEPTARLAKDLNIDHYFSQTLPLQKAKIIEDLQQQGRFVCYIGDGMNDSIAMKQAQVSISLNGASQLATDTAQILLLDQGLTHLPRLFELAQGFGRHMRTQFSIILLPSILGVSVIFLMGMGMGGMMLLSMIGLTASISYAIFDKPKNHHSLPIEAQHV